MNKISISDLQILIKKIDHKNNSIDKYFYKLAEEVGELAHLLEKISVCIIVIQLKEL